MHSIVKKIGFIISSFVITVTSVTVITAIPSYAAGCDTDFYSSNDIIFFNPCSGGGQCATGSGTLTGPAPTSLSGESNAEKVWNYFIGRGLSPVAAAGAMGNIEQESSFNPTIVEGGNGIGLGIIQWSFGRRTSLEAAANAAGVDLTDSSPENNDAALLFELNWLWDGEYKGMTWQEPTNAESTVDGDASVSFSADNTGNGSAMVFHSLVERSGDGTDGKQERIDGAKSFLEKFGAAGSVSGECSIGEGGLTLEQTSKIMEFYRDKEDDATLMDYTSLAGTCSGQGAPANRDPAVMGRIANCTSFSSYFINKFTDFKDAAGNGNEKVGLLYQNNPGADGDQTSHTPQLFAVFSRQSGASGAGHTGVIFGIHGDTVVIGEASCNAGYPGIVAREMTLAEMSSDDYTYFYTGSHVKQDVIQEVMNG